MTVHFPAGQTNGVKPLPVFVVYFSSGSPKYTVTALNSLSELPERGS